MALRTRAQARLFLRFSDLPPEIRDLIWEAARPESRVITLQKEFFSVCISLNAVAASPKTQPPRRDESIKLYHCYMNKIIDKTPIESPAMLLACHASRRIALRFFKKCTPDPLQVLRPWEASNGDGSSWTNASLSKCKFYSPQPTVEKCLKVQVPLSDVLSSIFWYQPERDVFYLTGSEELHQALVSFYWMQGDLGIPELQSLLLDAGDFRTANRKVGFWKEWMEEGTRFRILDKVHVKELVLLYNDKAPDPSAEHNIYSGDSFCVRSASRNEFL